MIKVMIHNGEHNSLVTEFPTAHLRFEEQLHSLGIWNPQGDIFPRDNEDEAIRVKLWSDDAFGNVLLGAVKETDSLRSINTMCRTVCDLKYSKFLELKEKLTVSPPESIKDVFAAVKAVNTPTVSFKLYSPMDINMEVKNEYGDVEDEYAHISSHYATTYGSLINSIIRDEFDNDSEMRDGGLATYMNDNDALSDKVISAFPSVEEIDGCLYGVLTVKTNGEMSEQELAVLKEEWIGQEADGWGEGFEQHSIDTDEGNMFVSFICDDDCRNCPIADECEDFIPCPDDVDCDECPYYCPHCNRCVYDDEN